MRALATFRLYLLLAVMGLSALLASTNAAAQEWPNRPIRLVLAYPTGGSTDFLARKVGEHLGARLGQPIVVEGKPGANERIASSYLLGQPADGYTILLVAVPHTTNPALFPDMPYDTRRDFQPLVLLADVSQLVVVRSESEIKSFADLVRMAKARPGQISYGSPGLATGTHLMMELLTQEADIQMLHVPYKGLAPMTTAVLGGHTEVGVYSVSPNLIDLVQSGRMRALGIPARARSQIAPGVPTFAEQGYPGVVSGTWFGLLMKAGTPRPVVERLNREINGVLALPDVREALVKAGMTPQGGTPEEFRRYLDSEMDKWGRLIRARNIKIE